MSMFEQLKEQFVKLYEDLSPWSKTIVAGGVAIVIYLPYRYYSTRPRKSPIKQDFEKDVIYLYQFPRVKHIASLSPYCLKLETWLRMADLKYENVDCGWFTRSCEGTLPFLEYNGREYPDSSLAIRDMTAIHSKETLEHHLSEEQRCIALAFERLAEYSLTSTIAIIRFTEFTDQVFDQLPFDNCGITVSVCKWLAKKVLPGRVITAMKMFGMGKHSRSEVINIAADDLRAISRYLGTKYYMFGFKPTRVDATLFGVLAQIVYAPYDLPQKLLVLSELTNLRDYCERIKERFWPDWEACTTKYQLNPERKPKV